MDRATKIARIETIRASALLAIKVRGKWEGIGGTRWRFAYIDDVEVGYRTPFQRLPAEPDWLRYQRELLGGKGNLPYGLNIWHARKKVLNVEWSDDGDLEVISYRCGEWEQTLERAARSIAAEDPNALNDN
jgi:hypothetical protein